MSKNELTKRISDINDRIDQLNRHLQRYAHWGVTMFAAEGEKRQLKSLRIEYQRQLQGAQ